jgi:hypothetical protein
VIAETDQRTGGIGPEDQLEVVASSKDGATFTPKADWIKLPVGHNLIDHLNTDLIVTHPDVVFYDFYEAWNTPNEGDKEAYLQKRSGILAQAAPNIGPMVRPRTVSASLTPADCASRCGTRSPPPMASSDSSSGPPAWKVTAGSPTLRVSYTSRLSPTPSNVKC